MRDCWEQRGCRYWQQRGKKTDRSEYDGYSSHEEQPLSSRRAATLLTKSSHSPTPCHPERLFLARRTLRFTLGKSAVFHRGKMQCPTLPAFTTTFCHPERLFSGAKDLAVASQE